MHGDVLPLIKPFDTVLGNLIAWRIDIFIGLSEFGKENAKDFWGEEGA